MRDIILSLKNISFAYRLEQQEFQVLKNLDMQVERGEFAAIQGPSGSGKSTLFYIIGCLLRPTSGSVIFHGQDVTRLNDEQLAFFRNRNIGFVFQQFHLLSRATVLENILLPSKYPAEIAGVDKHARERALSLAQRLGLSEHLDRQPNQLSGGQQQRVAIARALMHDVDLILADEPTGNLDSKSATQVLDLFDELHRQGKTIVLITHDNDVAKRCQKVFHFRDGIITKVDTNASPHTNAVGKSTEIQRSQASNKKDFSGPDFLAAQWRLFKSSLPLVSQNIVRNRTKSILTMLGVVIGVAAVLAMISLGQFTKVKVLEGYESLGVNKVQIYGYPNWRMNASSKGSLTPFQTFSWQKDLAPLREIFPEIKHMSPIMGGQDVKISHGGRLISDSAEVRGVNQEYFAVTLGQLDVGRNFTLHHIDQRSRVCVVGAELPKSLDVTKDDLLGQTLMITIENRISYPCKIIGVLKSQKTNSEWFKPDNQIYMPYTSYASLADPWAQRIYNVVMTVDDATHVESAGKKITNFFVKRYGKTGDFRVDNDSTMLAQMKRFLSIFTILLGSIAFLSLLVGGIGIHNMMLVSVADRLKEIGLRKAIGATSRSIRMLFLSESVVLCSIAGLIGIIIGSTICQIAIYAATKVVKNLKFEWVFEPLALLLSVASIVAVGIISGIMPAVKAEKLEVIEALRSE